MGAMNFFSDTQETASHFGDYIDDLHDVFRCNGIDFGSPEDFFAFGRTVKYHSELRGDVLRVVKSVMESETNISFRTILTIIAVASGGLDVARSDREMSIPVKLVIESLIGVGARRQDNAELPDGLYSDLTVKETARISTVAETSSGDGEASGHTETAEPFQIPVLNTLPPGGEEALGDTEGEKTLVERAASDSSMDGDPADYDSGPPDDSQHPSHDYGGSNTVAESLSRLELNSLQLKIYLDSIEQRISRMEPRLENVAPLAPAQPREEAGARYSATIPPETEPPSKTEPQPSHNDPPVLNQAGSNKQGVAATAGRVTTADEVTTGPPAALTRLWTDSPKFNAFRRPSALPILVGVATLLLAGSLFWGIGRDTGHVVVHPVDASADGAASGAGLAPHATAAAGVVGVAPVGNPSVASVRGAQGNSSASTPSYPGQDVSRPADAPTQAPKKSAQIPFSSRSSLSLGADSAIPPVVATETSEGVDSPDRTYRLSSEPASNRRVEVSSGVMAANLVSGPKPSYPTLANLTRTQGNVVMQVVISRNGTVEDMQVIKGHRLLRGAAKNAVRTWRYRPYKVNGVPVEVATVVSVDFSLHH
jgi:TonB family protein